MALRPDITPQVARIAATRLGDVAGPIRLCYEGAVTRLRTGPRGQREILQAGVELIDADSSGFEHAAILLDLDGDGRDELYVASDDQHQVRKYVFDGSEWTTDVIWEYTDDLGRFTWNIMAAPAGVLPPGS